MKVAIDISPLKTGHSTRGIGSYTSNLLNALKKIKNKLSVVEFTSPGSPPPADLIHHPYFDLFFHTLPIKKNTTRVVTIHDVIPLVFPKYYPRGLQGNFNLILQKLALPNVNAVICDSQTSKKDISDKLGYPESKIHVIYLAAGPNFKKITDSQNLAKVTKKHKLFKNFILYVGDINWNKNIENLLEAVKIADVNLVLVGSAFKKAGLTEVKKINEKIQKLKLQKNIIKTGYITQDELTGIYNLAKATVLPSFYEGFGLPVLESMACGTPVICSKVASLAEIGADTAIYCDPNSPRDIAAKINYVENLGNQKRKEISQKCQDYAFGFTWNKVASQTVQVYKSVIEAK